MSTIKQQKTAENYLGVLKSGDLINKGEILRNSGYTDYVSKMPSRIFDSKGFQEVLAQIDEQSIIKKWEQWAVSDKDKRNALEAGKEIMKLKNRYPSDTVAAEMGDFKLLIKKNRE